VIAKLLAAAALAGWLLAGVQTWRLTVEAERQAREALAREAALRTALISQTEAANDAAQAARRARLDSAAAGRAADSLREHVARVAGRCSAAATDSPAGAAPGDLLADMLGRLEAAGRELAAEADRARAAGAACERSYDALTRITKE
jgi:hypothetical protein